MLKRFIFFPFIFSFSFLLSSDDKFPAVVDFGKLKLFQESLLYDGIDSWTWELGNSAFELGYTAFNDSPEIGSFLNYLKRHYQIDTAIETGVFLGATTLFLSSRFDEIHAIEAVESIYNTAQNRLKSFPNIHFHLGSSEQVLREILPSLKEKRLLFYLDAHGGGYEYWPILAELEEISKTHKDNCIVVIDDFQVPDTEIHGISDGINELSHDYIRNKLNRIFTGYNFHYLIPKNRTRSAKFVAIPKKWQGDSYIGRIDVLPGLNFYELPINLSMVKQAGFEIRISNQFFNGHDQSNYEKEIRDDRDLKKIIVFNNTVDPIYLSKFPKEKLVLFLLEPLKLPTSYYEPCSRVYTWNDDLVDGIKFFKLFYPYLMPMQDGLVPFEEKKLCVMISGSDNAYPERENELYSERMKMVAFFEAKPEGEFDIFGRFWVKRHYRDFRGSIPGDHSGEEKISTLKKYRFSICFENTKNLPGYITEKIFGCFAAGCVPIYWGASNIETYIPKECFIDYREFKDREELYQFIKTMPKNVYEQYLEAIRHFLKSEKAQVFSPDYFGKILYEAITQS